MSALSRMIGRATGQIAPGLRPRPIARFEAAATESTGFHETSTETAAPQSIDCDGGISETADHLPAPTPASSRNTPSALREPSTPEAPSAPQRGPTITPEGASTVSEAPSGAHHSPEERRPETTSSVTIRDGAPAPAPPASPPPAPLLPAPVIPVTAVAADRPTAGMEAPEPARSFQSRAANGKRGLPRAGAADAPPDISIHIGRLELRTTSPEARPGRQKRTKPDMTSLADYLKGAER